MARRLLAAAAVLLLGGCNWYYQTLPSPDDLMAAVPWFDHMIKSRAVHPYQRADIPRTTVPGTVPVSGGEADWRAEFATLNTTTADRLVNPPYPRKRWRGVTPCSSPIAQSATGAPGRGTAPSAPGSARPRCSPTGPADSAMATSTASSVMAGVSCRDMETRCTVRRTGGRS